MAKFLEYDLLDASVSIYHILIYLIFINKGKVRNV